MFTMLCLEYHPSQSCLESVVPRKNVNDANDRKVYNMFYQEYRMEVFGFCQRICLKEIFGVIFCTQF